MSDNQYTTANYGSMIRDRTRIDGYLAALRKVIVPGETTVLELGTGTGVVAFAAAMAGAKVIAVEPNPSIETAREIAKLNGIDGIEFIQAMSTEIETPPCDVLISDMRGVLPLLEMHIPSIIDARRRLLKPGGVMIARFDEMYAAPVEAAKTWDDNVGHWDDNPVGLDMTPAKRVTANNIFHLDCKPTDLLAAPQQFGRLDFATIESPHVQAEISYPVTRTATCHGLSLWFDSQLDDDIRLSNAPGLPLLAYGRPFFPFLDPIELREGETLDLAIRARLVRGAYAWTWSGGVRGDASRTFDQATWDGVDASLDDLARFRLDATPLRSASSEKLRFLLERMDGTRSIAQLATDLSAAFADLDRAEAIAIVSEVVAAHGSRR